MKLTKYLLSISLLLFALPSFGEGTQTWQQKSYDDFSKGTAKGIAIRSDGALELAPAFKAIHTSPSTFIWAVTPAPDGAIYVGSGSPARVYRVTADGNATVIFEPKELQVQALAVDKEGNVYAATSPDGKVYKIAKSAAGASKPAPAPAKSDVANKDASTVAVDPNYSSSVFFDPKTKYIWTIGFDSDGRLYVGTGDRGEIFRVNKTGEGSVFFKSDEAHIRTLAFDANNNVIAGSDGSGLVYRITPAGEGFVLYSAPKKEITALTLDSVGNIYVAAVGEKRSGGNTGAPSIVSQLVFTPPGAPGGLNAPQLPSMNSSTQTGGSDIYMLAADGSPKRLWTSKDDVVYALAFDVRGRLLAGTGNKGRIVAIEKSGEYSDLIKASATQVTGFASAPGHALFAVTSNLGKVFKLSAAPDAEGTFESDVYDAHIFSRWGRAEVRGSGDFEFFTRSGNVDNPDRNWSPWKKVDLSKDARIEAPPARFIQWKVAMQAKSGARLENVKVNYRPKNVAPVIDEIAVQAGAKFNTNSSPRVSSDTVMINLGSQNSGNNSPQPRFDSPVSAQRDRGSIAVRWSAHDDNDDDLFYSLYYKGDGETRWKLLKDKITDKFYSWDAGLLPDGGYTVRVVASDAPSHSPDEALLDSKESARFEVDSTAPRIDGLAAKIDGGVLHITFTSRDTFSAIKRAEFSVDANEWQFVEPVGQLSDAQMEAYDFNAPLPVLTPEPDSKKSKGKREKLGAGENDSQQLESTTQPEPVLLSNEHVVVVRVYDRFDNVGIAKIVVK